MNLNTTETSQMGASPVSDVLGFVLRSLRPDRTQLGTAEGSSPEQSAEFLVVSYRRDFTALWNITDGFLAWLTSAPRTVVLIWDDTPSDDLGDVALSEYVTACDWAVALCLLSDRYARSHNQTPEWKLLIADLTPAKHASAPGVRLFSALQRGTARPAPWVQLFQAEEFAAIFDALDSPRQPHPRTADLEIIRITWAAILVNPATASDRHAIANLVAPRVLLAGMGKRKEIGKDFAFPLIRALDLLMLAVGLVPEALEQMPGPWVGFLRWKNVVKQFVLIDDMAEFGWEAFLRGALGARGPQLEARSDPKDWRAICSQDKVVLFLDLRLFSRRPLDEVVFFAELLQSAAQFRIDDDKPTDSGFYDSELEALERAIKSRSQDSPDYYVALTFLPRLISLTDPTLPIIIFSSTGRREIAEALRPFGNIVLGFDKPRFFGDESSSVLAETRQKFEMVLQDALVLAEGRNLCRRLRNNPPAASCDDTSGRVVEIFLDESGSGGRGRFAVGGIVVVHADNQSPSHLDAELRNAGLVWEKKALPKHAQDYGPHLSRLQEFFTARGIGIYAFGIVRSWRSAEEQPRSRLLREGSLDLQNLDMVTDALEATIFDIIDTVAPEPSNICVHLATRIYPADEGLDTSQALEDWGLTLVPTKTRTGTDGQVVHPKDEKKYFSVSSQDGRQITRSAIRRRLSRCFKLPIGQARAVQLNERKPPFAREIHHLADWIGRFARWDYAHVPAVARTWFEQGFLCEDDEAFSGWLEAARAGDEGRFVEALHCVYQANAHSTHLYAEGNAEQRNQDKALSYSKFVRLKAARWSNEVGPSAFRELCLRLRTHPGYKTLRVDQADSGDFNPNKSHLHRLFDKFGDVVSVRINRSVSGNNYALVTMSDEISAGRAFRATRTIGLTLAGQRLRVFPAQRIRDL